jgi:hypothetical protein
VARAAHRRRRADAGAPERFARCKSADDAYPRALRLLAEWTAAGCPIDRGPLAALLRSASAAPARSPSA